MKKQRKNKARRTRATNTPRHNLWQPSTPNIILNARKYNVYECLINSSWREEGLARILLSRKQPDGNFLFGVYLVDIFCLGLKNTFCNANFSLSEYEHLKAQIFQDGKPLDCPVNLAHQIIYGAIRYASKLGFKPQKDFDVSKHILEDETKYSGETGIEFGKNGKPFFVAGHGDNVESIIKKLEGKLGTGNFELLLPLEQ